MKNVVNALEKILGPDRVSTSETICQTYQFNCFLGQNWLMKPDIVVLAQTTEEVSEILKAANEHRVPVTPKGTAGGGGTGGPMRGGILLDLSLMDRIITIDADNMKAVAEAGCSFFKLAQELFKHNMMLPIAGYGCGPNVAASAITPANGFGKTRYGPNIDLVEGFEVVMPSGEVTRIGSMAYADLDFGPYYRYVTGPDLVGLFTKSNGAFGIVTKVAYHCLRRPEHWAFHSYYWPFERIQEVTRTLMEATALEMFDVHLDDKWRWVMEGDFALPEDCHFILIFAVNADNEDELRGKERSIEQLCRTYGGTCLPVVAEDFHTTWPTTAFAGLSRPSKPSSPPKVGRPYMYILDELIYPTSRLPDVYRKVMETCKRHGLWDPPRLHVFDGYPMKRQVMSSQTWILVDVEDRKMVRQFHDCQEEFRGWFGERGGTFQMKTPPLVPEYSWTNQPGTLELLKGIKGLLDPNNILSPGTFEPGSAK